MPPSAGACHTIVGLAQPGLRPGRTEVVDHDRDRMERGRGRRHHLAGQRIRDEGRCRDWSRRGDRGWRRTRRRDGVGVEVGPVDGSAPLGDGLATWPRFADALGAGVVVVGEQAATTTRQPATTNGQPTTNRTRRTWRSGLITSRRIADGSIRGREAIPRLPGGVPVPAGPCPASPSPRSPAKSFIAGGLCEESADSLPTARPRFGHRAGTRDRLAPRGPDQTGFRRRSCLSIRQGTIWRPRAARSDDPQPRSRSPRDAAAAPTLVARAAADAARHRRCPTRVGWQDADGDTTMPDEPNARPTRATRSRKADPAASPTPRATRRAVAVPVVGDPPDTADGAESPATTAALATTPASTPASAEAGPDGGGPFTIRQGGIGSVAAAEVSVNQGGIGAVRAGAVSVELGGVGAAMTDQLDRPPGPRRGRDRPTLPGSSRPACARSSPTGSSSARTRGPRS